MNSLSSLLLLLPLMLLLLWLFSFNVYVKPVEINRFIESLLIPMAAACVKCARGY